MNIQTVGDLMWYALKLLNKISVICRLCPCVCCSRKLTDQLHVLIIIQATNLCIAL